MGEGRRDGEYNRDEKAKDGQTARERKKERVKERKRKRERKKERKRRRAIRAGDTHRGHEGQEKQKHVRDKDER